MNPLTVPSGTLCVPDTLSFNFTSCHSLNSLVVKHLVTLGAKTPIKKRKKKKKRKNGNLSHSIFVITSS